MTANSYFEYVLTLLGWLVNNGVWQTLAATGLFALPLLAKLIALWLKARGQGTDEGNVARLLVVWMEHSLYSALLVILFAGVPFLNVDINTLSYDSQRTKQCGWSVVQPGDSGYPTAFASLIYQLTGHYERAGALAELVQQADKASVARYLGGDIKTALAQKPSSFPQQLLTALRSLVQNEYRLNNPECGSDGWLTEDALWLISKTTADRVRAWLLQHGVASVPENNNRLFDELLAHQLIVANEDKAIWRCIIRSDKGWSPIEPLTLLRLTPSAIWEPGEQRPACFAGDVTPVSEAEPVPELNSPTQPLPEIADDPRLGDNNNFLQWLKNHTSSSATVNTRNGKVHVVENHLFLISPGIFKIYASETTGNTGDGWKLAQRMFQESGLALRCNDDSFIWTCEVRAPQKKSSQLKGFLMEDPKLVLGEKMPVNNPWLKLVAPQN
ncbi:TraI domain-containing protein [Cronobacter sakazakii]|nr:TraI domain-containing protein [Cronobacter sakazakii]ELY3828740.1 TraI domain-containing protein [Cronobacter sakazakii]ELY3830523.1 TraI domain-containing protein [Cronobacter sakazakii]ELY4142816.1 TraI domain-containing protein [Cronobacter sakazakii]